MLALWEDVVSSERVLGQLSNQGHGEMLTMHWGWVKVMMQVYWVIGHKPVVGRDRREVHGFMLCSSRRRV